MSGDDTRGKVFRGKVFNILCELTKIYPSSGDIAKATDQIMELIAELIEDAARDAIQEYRFG